MIALTAKQEPTGKLGPEPWLTSASTHRLMDVLCAEGADVRFVGGCVRDAIAHRPITDVDIGTPDPPDKVMDTLGAAGIKTIPTGLDHGTVTAVVDSQTYEITTLRKDIEALGRRAKVAFTDDWVIDSERRDFTINALSATRDGDVFDYHDGIPHLAHGQIRFIGLADARVEEDYLRILRYFRFFGWYGRPPYDQDAFIACRKHAAKLSDISLERIHDEVLKIIMAPEAADIFMMMRDAQVLEVILPEATEIGRLRTASWLAKRGLVIDGLAPHPMRRLGAVLKPGTDAGTVAQRLRLSNREVDRLANMLNLVPAFKDVPSEAKVQQLLHRHGTEAVADASLIAWAERLSDIARIPAAESIARQRLMEKTFAWKPKKLPVSGKDVQSLGIQQGPKIGRVLEILENWWADREFAPDRAACLEQLRQIVEQQKGKS